MIPPCAPRDGHRKRARVQKYVRRRRRAAERSGLLGVSSFFFASTQTCAMRRPSTEVCVPDNATDIPIMTAACTIAVPAGTPWDMSYDRFISFPMFHDRVDFCWYLDAKRVCCRSCWWPCRSRSRFNFNRSRACSGQNLYGCALKPCAVPKTRGSSTEVRRRPASARRVARQRAAGGLANCRRAQRSFVAFT